jgi:hypothetical protein
MHLCELSTTAAMFLVVFFLSFAFVVLLLISSARVYMTRIRRCAHRVEMKNKARGCITAGLKSWSEQVW